MSNKRCKICGSGFIPLSISHDVCSSACQDVKTELATLKEAANWDVVNALAEVNALKARNVELEAETNEQNANLIEQARLHTNEVGRLKAELEQANKRAAGYMARLIIEESRNGKARV